MTDTPARSEPLPRPARTAGIVMGTAVGLDAVFGVAALLVVPYHRRLALAPSDGRAIYLAHAVLGVVLGVAAVALVPLAGRMGRLARLGAVTGLVGIGVAAAGGLLTIAQTTRLAGIALMLLGSVAAVGGYLIPLVD